MRILRSLFSYLLPVFLGLIAVEMVLEWSANSSLSKLPPYYYRSGLVSQSGESLPSGAKDYATVLHPAGLYRNYPGVTKRVRINSSGFRGRETELKKKEKRVVVLGSSAAFGWGLENDEATFAAQLERHLPGVEVINAGVSGYFSGQEWALLLERVLDYSPDLVVSFSGWNDFAFQWDKPVTAEFVGAGNLEGVEAKLRLAYALLEGSFWQRLLTAVRYGAFPRLTERIVEALGGEHRELPRLPPSLLAQGFAKNMQRMASASSAAGAKFLVVLQPDSRVVLKAKTEQGWQAKRYQEYLQEVKQRLDQGDISYFDLNDCERCFKKGDFLDIVHLSPEGYGEAVSRTESAVRSKLFP